MAIESGKLTTVEELNSLAGLIVRGETYPFREQLRAAGFRWNPERKEWVLDSETEQAVELCNKLVELRRQAEDQRYAAFQADENRPAFPWDDKYRKQFPAAYLQIGF